MSNEITAEDGPETSGSRGRTSASEISCPIPFPPGLASITGDESKHAKFPNQNSM